MRLPAQKRVRWCPLIVRRRQALAPLGAAALEHQPTILRRHTGAKAMRLGTTTIVWLKCSLRHSQSFSTQVKSVRLTACADYVKKTRPELQPGRETILMFLKRQKQARKTS
jgi:hypothetical protein